MTKQERCPKCGSDDRSILENLLCNHEWHTEPDTQGQPEQRHVPIMSMAEIVDAERPSQENIKHLAQEWREQNGYKTRYSLLNPADRECSPEVGSNFHLNPDEFDAALAAFHTYMQGKE